MIWWIVTGRLAGDNEDSLYIFQCDSGEAAFAAFRRSLWDASDNGGREMPEPGEEEEGDDLIYILHAVKVVSATRPLHVANNSY